MTVYLDLDGVFADFKSKFEDIVGFPYHQDPKKAWGILDKIDHLFLTLDLLQDSNVLFNDIWFSGNNDVRILTALPMQTNKLITAAADKREWVRKHLSGDIQVICTAGWKGKRDFCKPGDILIDDML